METLINRDELFEAFASECCPQFSSCNECRNKCNTFQIVCSLPTTLIFLPNEESLLANKLEQKQSIFPPTNHT